MPISLAIILFALASGLIFWVLHRRKYAGLTADERSLLKAGTFDQYTLKGVRKHAAMSTMYKAVDTATKKTIALRILHPEYSLDSQHVKGFLRRGEMLGSLNSKHPDLPIVRLIKCGQYTFGGYERPFIAVEYFEGQDLFELLRKKGILSVAEATSIIKQVAKALSIVLRENVWHHQMALQAIMVQYNEQHRPDVRLVDFDLYQQEQNKAPASADGVDTKPIFMSPEQFEGKIVDSRSDIYSLGILYYTLLNGFPPFQGGYSDLEIKHRKDAAPLLPDRIPIPAKDIVTKMIQKRSLNRFQTMEEVIGAIDELKPDPSWEEQPDKPRPPWLVAQTTSAKPDPNPPQRTKWKWLVNFISREIPAMFSAFIGSVWTLISKMASLKKIAIFVLIALIGVAAYLILKKDRVSGDMLITVQSKDGKPISDATVTISFVEDSGSKQYLNITDVRTGEEKKSQFQSNTSADKKLNLQYSATPGLRFSVEIKAQDFNVQSDTFTVVKDTTLVYTLQRITPPPPTIVTVYVRDNSNNPIPSVSLSIKGKSGKAYPISLDKEGMGNIAYDPATEGLTPLVDISMSGFDKSIPKNQTISSMRLLININQYFPYDDKINKLIREARNYLRQEKWEDAIESLKKVIEIQPGSGSGRARTLLAQALFEDDKDNYKKVIDELSTAFIDAKNIKGSDRTITIENMHYYNVLALKKKYKELNKEPPSKEELKRACMKYRGLFQNKKYQTIRATDTTVKEHWKKVDNIYDNLK